MDRLSDYDYHLPEELIAQEPLEDRAAARLLLVGRHSGECQHRTFREVPDLLQEGDLLVMNDTRVTAVRLFGVKVGGSAEVEALLLKAVGGPGEFEAMMRPGRRLRPGDRVDFGHGLLARVVANLTDGLKHLAFEPATDLDDRLRQQGLVPLPPYIHTKLDEPERYQTVYAATPGSAAAPTAGLHFTPEILAALKAKGIQTARVTLDVGIDTFRPISVENLDEHRMHGERCTVSEETAAAVAECKGRIFAVGTTTVRTLESMATDQRTLRVGSEVTHIFIRPGYQFRVVDGFFTNFHLPQTTMLLMLAAFIGQRHLFHAYKVAVQDRYRFLSFGDSMLIHPETLFTS